MEKPHTPPRNNDPEENTAFYREALKVQQQAQRLLITLNQLEANSECGGTPAIFNTCPEEVTNLIATLDTLALLYHSRRHRQKDPDHD